ncbi:winged helix-turn-helix transcriptional regulator [Streptomyces sp. NBC_01207]|uniref:winged helix-turn-helix transcriptional regulator n=1 Tax=Streptomyces sp. NBC_01207 TaxID=2903772 RepID=UPI002E0FCB8A|nr:helix-turn-helix transcriptional regulator [Streptomyces sp. NBC_01207]
MAAARLPSNDLPRVAEALEMITPRWSAWVLMTLASQPGPLRYTKLKEHLPWLGDGQLHPRLRALSDAGLVERTAQTRLHVTYGLTARGRELMPSLTALAGWGDGHLEKNLVLNLVTGKTEPERIPAAQNAEDTLAVIGHRHATVLLWTLKARGTSTMAALSAEAMPDHGPSAIYPPIRRLIDDGLVAVTRDDAASLQLTAPGQALAPIYLALSTWATARPLPEAQAHPVWGAPRIPAANRSGQWAAHQARKTSPAVAVAQPPAPAPATAWRPMDLFSAPTSGPSR